MTRRTSRRIPLEQVPTVHQKLFLQAEQELKIRRYAYQTRKGYLGHLRRFFQWLQEEPIPRDPQCIKDHATRQNYFPGFLGDKSTTTHSDKTRSYAVVY